MDDSTTPPAKLCLEAPQWQAALQAARKLRNDSTPLSKFAIERAAGGYRAVEPKSKLRYEVRQAPDDAPLHTGEDTPAALEPPAAAEGARPSAAAESVVATPSAPLALTSPLAGVSFRVLSDRVEEPTATTPIFYRELMLAVEPGTERAAVEGLLREALAQLCAALAARPAGKYLQLAAFDHVFEQRPQRGPLLSLSWKDWRGEPTLSAPAVTAESVPRPSAPPVAVEPTIIIAPSVAPPTVADTGASEAPTASAVTPLPAPSQVARDAGAATASVPPAASAPTSPAPEAAVPPEAAAPRPAEPPRSAASAADAPPEPAAPPAATAAEPAPLAAGPSAERLPIVQGRRRRPNEDLIGDLFEQMHQLHFLPDMVSGVEFVLRILGETLPSEAALIHVFGIDERAFVVVRGAGVSPSIVGHRTPDSSALFRDVMRRQRTLHLPQIDADERFRDGRWAKAQVAPESALCGPVHQGGRYLGLIELVNPAGKEPYHDAELNALDYVCEQLAEFLSSRPLVLADDVLHPAASARQPGARHRA